MKTDVIQLQGHDDVVSACDKMGWAKTARILLVWPERERILERRVDLVLLLRHCQQLGAQLALVTRSAEVQANARLLGIAVFDSPLMAQKRSWRRQRTARKREIPASRMTAGELTARRDALRPKWTALEEHVPLRVTFFAVGVLAVLSLVLFFLPGARVILTPVERAQTLDITLRASPLITAVNLSGGVPALQTSAVVEGQDELNATGSTTIGDASARGVVRFTNLTDQVVQLPASTVVLTQDAPPVRFLTDRMVELPAGTDQTVEVTASAEQPGTAGNVAADAIRAVEGSVGLRVSVTNPEPLTGGTNRRGTIPSAADYEVLRKRLLATLAQTAMMEMQSTLGEEQHLVDASLQVKEVLEETRDPQDGEAGDRLRIKMRVEYTIWYVAGADLRAAAISALDANQPERFHAIPDSLMIVSQSPARMENEEIAAWRLQVRRRIQADWSSEGVIQIVLGRRVADASQRLQSMLDLDTAPVIQVQPGWWGRLPYLPFRIKVEAGAG